MSTRRGALQTALPSAAFFGAHRWARIGDDRVALSHVSAVPVLYDSEVRPGFSLIANDLHLLSHIEHRVSRLVASARGITPSI